MKNESSNREFDEQTPREDETGPGHERPEDRFRRLLAEQAEEQAQKAPDGGDADQQSEIPAEGTPAQEQTGPADWVAAHHPTGTPDVTGGWYAEISDLELGELPASQEQHADETHLPEDLRRGEDVSATSPIPHHPTGAPEQTGGWFYDESGKPAASTFSMPAAPEQKPDAGITRPTATHRNSTEETLAPASRTGQATPSPLVPRRVDEVDPDATQVTPAAYRATVNQRAAPAAKPPAAASTRPIVTPPLKPPASAARSGNLGPDTQSLKTGKRGNGNNLGGCLARLGIGTIFIGIFVAVVFFSFGIYKYFAIIKSADFPDVRTLHEQASQFETATIYDRNGNKLYEIVDPQAGRRTYVRLDQISPYVIAATLATEDKEFYNHPGYDPMAMVRAIWQNRISGETVSGASTITQQLARTLLLTPEERSRRTVERKEREIVLAAEITRLYSKDEILELYLNEIYYSNLAYGIEAAAQTYFDTTAQNLTLAQATFLAGLPQSPGVYDIFTNREETLRRHRDVILLTYELSQEKGCIPISTQPHPVCVSAPEADQARQEMEVYNFQPKVFTRDFPHWVEYIRAQLEEEYGEEMIYRSGFRVYTTLDGDLQRIAERVVAEQLQQLIPNNATDAALVHMDNDTGEILAMVGSADFNNEAISGQVNMALAPRQTGSAFKPFVYAAAFGKGWTPATLIWDVSTEFPPTGIPNDGLPPYEPVNYDLRFHGPQLARSALANSYNIPAVKALQYVGIYRDPESNEDQGGMIRYAEKVGITTLTRNDYGLALALGGGEISLMELTRAYSVFPNGGKLVEPISITKVEARSDKDREYEVLFEKPKVEMKDAIPPEHAYLITSILSDNEARTPAFGANSVLNLPFPAGAKTGTTNDFRDNWTMGFTVQDTVGVWVGNADNSPMSNTSGLSGAAPIWANYMREMVNVLHGGQSEPFQRPNKIEDHIICVYSGTKPSEFCPSQKSEIFAKDQPPLKEEEDLWRVVHVDTWTGKLISDACKDFEAEEFTLNVTDPDAQKWIRDTADGQAWAAALNFNPPVLFSPDKECNVSDPRPVMFFPGLEDGQKIDYTPLDIYVVAYATENFREFRVEYGLGDDPASWETLIGGITQQYRQPERIYTWDLGEEPRGKITLRMYMRSVEDGRYAEHRIHLDLQQPLPTATPTATATPLPTVTTTPTLEPTSTPTLPLPGTLVPTLTLTPTSVGVIPALLTAIGGG